MKIKKTIKWVIKRMVPSKVRDWILYDVLTEGQVLFSQEGEDKLLDRLFPKRKDGFFVDIGAHHPRYLSNTYFFYQRGWRGINIDAMPGSMELFNSIRPDDYNLEAAISDKEEVLEFHIFSAKEFNTLSEKEAKEYATWPGIRLLERRKLKTIRLSSVLDDYFIKHKIREIDFLSVDVEGHDLRVLQSNNWIKYRPKVVLAEELNKDIVASSQSEVTAFLTSVGYCLMAKTYNTAFYRRNDIFF